MTVPFPIPDSVKYGSYSFPSTTNASVSSTQEYASDGVTKKHTRNTIRLEFIISGDLEGGNSCDVSSHFDNVRRILERPSLELRFLNYGFTTSIIGSGDDLEGGPFPRIIDWEPVGFAKAVRVVWECDFFTLGCLFPNPHESATAPIIVKEFQYERRSRLSSDGTHIVAYDGVMEVSKNTALSLNVIPTNTILTYFENLTAGITNFQSGTSANYKLVKHDINFDKTGRKIEFSIEYERVKSKNPFFAGTFAVEAMHTMRSSINGSAMQGKGFRSWYNEISARITLQEDQPSVHALTIFLWILWQRLYAVNDFANDVDEENEKEEANQNKPRNILMDLTLSDNLYGFTHSFSAQYLGVYDLDNFLTQSGMYTRVYIRVDSAGRLPWQDGYSLDANVYSDWQYHASWSASFQDYITDKSPHGSSQWNGNNTKLIFDPCIENHYNILQGGVLSAANSAGLARLPTGLVVPESEFLQAFSQLPTVNNPEQDSDSEAESNLSKQQSFAHYDVDFEVIEDSRTAMLAYDDWSQEIDEYKYTTQDEAAEITGTVDDFLYVGKKGFSASTEKTSTIVSSGTSDFMVILRGSAVRAGYKIPTPTIQTVGNLIAYRAPNARVRQGIYSRGEIPMYAATWEIPFFVPGELKGDLFEGMNFVSQIG